MVRKFARAEFAGLIDRAFDRLAFRDVAGGGPVAQVAGLEVGVEGLAVGADGEDAVWCERGIGLRVNGGTRRAGAHNDIRRRYSALARVGEQHLRLRRVPFRLRRFLRVVAEDERALFVAHDEIRTAVAVHIRHADLPAHARVAVDKVRHPVHGFVGVAHKLEPVEHRGIGRAGIRAGAVRPDAFAGDDVLQPIAIHVHQFDRVELRKGHAVAAFARFLVHENVRLELNLAARVALLELLVPREAVAVRCERGDDVRQAVAVHVVGVHLRAGGGEKGLVKFPHRIARERRGLLEPAAAANQIRAAVPVHIAHAEAVRKLAPLPIFRDRREHPLGRDIFPVGFRVAEVALVIADDLRLSVAINVRERRRLVVHLVEDLMPRPVLLLALWIEIKKRGRARQAKREHVVPTIAIEVVHEREEVVRRVGVLAAEHALEAGELDIRAVLLGLRRARGGINLVALGEVRPFPPIRPRNGVGLPVVVEVAEDRALGPVVFFEMLFLQRRERAIRGGGGGGDGEGGGGECEKREGANQREHRARKHHGDGSPKRGCEGQGD